MFVFFFFQAEDGIRDVAVTGVQTCALPIFTRVMKFVERQMAKSNSIWDLQDALSDEMERLDDAMKAWETARLYGDLDFELDDWLAGLGVNVYEDPVIDVIVHKNEVSVVWDVGAKQPPRHGSRRFDIVDALPGG